MDEDSIRNPMFPQNSAKALHSIYNKACVVSPNFLLRCNYLKLLTAEILRECSSHTMRHVSHVTCHVSHVILFLFFLYPEKKFDKVVELVGAGSVINGAYPV